MDDGKLYLLSAFVFILSVLWLRSTLYERKIASIPAVASSGIWEYYTGGFRYFLRAPEMVQEGYEKYPSKIFRVPTPFAYNFVVSGPILIDELAGAPESVLSSVEAIKDNFQGEITIGPEVFRNSYHLDVIRTTLTQNLGKCFPDVFDEIGCAVDETLALDGTDWKLTPVFPTVMTLVARTTNRLLVGRPICRDKEYIKLVVQYTIDVAIRAQLINLLPSVLQPILGPLISARNQSIRKGIKHLGSLIEYRLAQEQEFGRDWPDKPNDFISWLLEMAEAQERTVPALVLRILTTNMVAIHPTSSAFTHTLFDLTTHSSHIGPMREEVERVVNELGWTKAALLRMHKIDSFLRESQRMHDIGPMTLLRKVQDPNGFKFSDGSVLPFGSTVCAAGRSEHLDPRNYEDAKVFDGFRFSKMREDRDQAGVFNRHMISTGVDHLAFGHKQHACPGRFFAADELKAMLAHILMNYDIRAEVEGVRPADDVFGIIVVPNRIGKVWVRKRH
ncbi:cytochrome P450 [Mycena epipterygia]|nr:cytochrome P450 [Mycena epipterygia]